MNDELREFARQKLKDGLAQCSDGQKLMFKRMYAGPTEPRERTPAALAAAKEMDINDVVDAMPDDKLDWAMQQVESTLAKAAAKLAEDTEAATA